MTISSLSNDTRAAEAAEALGVTITSAKELKSDQEVRWCPGCGDYSILKQVQTVLPEFGHKKEDIVFISGIGCSSRFPYYMDTYGMHSIHGRAPAIATGLKMSRPELSVWVITGDGDSLSIGGNHFAHVLRRNVDLNVLLFNNEIYGLTKGQYSPTSHEGQVTKSSPMGAADHPFNPVAFALGADASFVARTMDRDPKHQQEMLRRSEQHRGTSMLEIYQNCNVFNDGAFSQFTDKQSKPEETIFLEHGKPLVYGREGHNGIRMDGFTPVAVDLQQEDLSADDLWVHDETDWKKAHVLARFSEMHDGDGHSLPRPFGVFFRHDRPRYEDVVQGQIQEALQQKGRGDLQQLLRGRSSWRVN